MNMTRDVQLYASVSDRVTYEARCGATCAQGATPAEAFANLHAALERALARKQERVA